MNRNGNTYTFIYASVMVVLVATVLSVAAINLKPYQDKNVEIEKKQNILRSIGVLADATEAEKIFEETISELYIVDAKGNKIEGDAFAVKLKKEDAKPVDERKLPVYVVKLDGVQKYIIPLQGAGLWGPIWGYIALDDDMNTIYGATFDHAQETPGLGAEISTESFQKAFKGKTIYSQSGELVSIVVAKAGEKAEPLHSVDAISGGTITCKGLQDMMMVDLTSYQEFFNKMKRP